MKTQTQVVVIGGGVVGCSVLYHLTKLGWQDVVLLERAELTAGSTWHAAGGMHTLNGDPNVAALQNYTINLYRQIEQVSGVSCGIHQTGCLYLAVTDQQIEFFQTERAKARHLGLALDFISLEEAKRLNPLIQTDDYRAAMFDPNDGHVDPSGVTQAYAQAARLGGAEIYRHTPVTNLTRLADGEWLVTTPKGGIRAQYVVNAGGLWAREVGRLMGVDLPIVPMEHQYIITNDVPELASLDREIPFAVDFESGAYWRQERQGLLLGTYEQDCRHWAVRGTPQDFGVELLPSDLDRIAEPLSAIMERVPAVARAGIKRVVNGGMVFAPDGNPVIGPLPGLPTAFVAAGVMAGFSQGGGVGLAVANWIVHGEPGMDVFAMDVARFGNFAGEAYVREKTRENYQRRFILPAPNEELPAARPLRTSPIYDRLAAAGAVFGVAAGMEVPLWYAHSATEAHEAPTFHRSKAFNFVAEECRSVRQGVGLWETSSYCKIEVRGAQAAAWLDGILANPIPATVGRASLCPMLTRQGRVLGDVVVARIAQDQFLLIGSPAAESLYMRWLDSHVAGNSVQITSITDALCGLSLTGPFARAVLAAVCDDDVSSGEFPFMHVRELTVGLATALALRVSFTGELGYELYTTPNLQRHVYDALLRAGRPFGLKLFGARALNSLRMEKAYGGWGRELTQDYTVVEAGLSRFVRTENRSFIGRDEAASQLGVPPARRLRLLSIVSDNPDPNGGEPVLLRGKPVARLTSAAFGHSLGYALGFAYLPPEIDTGTSDLQVQILGVPVPARVLDEAPYDPKGLRLRT
jgi:dimethylglycine dehydrogenase